ncbi:hypothetical protein [Antarctobacter heliothermus]|uniref:Sulfotransferase family protein n=1 Tax=Antarctobacter heliothermus TaxID=74033 RepID=A0A239DET6_9RHOB|nr:hypothetical protein [Antarctobacter heliothermus]SNS31006.1 hypothetical protein SAMN04488078_101095 [Antarctobacter heliothermus]
MKAVRLVLHIGHGKTGSTSIQRALRASGPLLADRQVLFPDPGRHDNHQLLFPFLTGSLPDDPVQMSSLAPTPEAAHAQAAQLWNDLRSRIANERPQTVVLSCENQFRPFPPEAMARLRETCAQIADETQVIAYLRSPSPFFLSNVQQDVKKRPEFRRISASRIRDALGPFVSDGPGPITARLFSREALLNGDVVTDFMAQALPEIDAGALTRGPAEENSSVSAEAMALLQQIFRGTRPVPARFRDNLKAFRKIVVATDAKVPGAARPRLFDQVRAVTEARVTDLDWTRDILGVAFPDLGPASMPQEDAEAAFQRLRDVGDICAVDAARQESLWQASVAEATDGRMSRLLRRIGLN